MRYRFLVSLQVILLVGGCAWQGDFTALASKNINADDLRIDRSKSKGRVTGEDCQQVVILFPTSGPPSIEEAADNAVESVNAQLLTDVRVEYSSFYFPLVFGQTCWQVEGDAYDTFE